MYQELRWIPLDQDRPCTRGRSALARVAAGLMPLVVAAAFSEASPAQAQIGFTEFALTDPDLNSSPETDFWIASAAPADVDGDGDLDLLVAGYFVVYFATVEDRLTLYRNDGLVDGSTWALTPIPVDPSGLYFTAADLAWGDYDNDGDPDVLVAASGETALYRNDAGTLTRTATLLPAYAEDSGFSTLDLHSASWADFDNDGDLDVLLPSIYTTAGYEPTQVLRNDGPGAGDAWTFTDVGAGLPPAANALGVWADLEDDGDLDLLFGNVSPYGDSFLSVYRNDAGTLQLESTDLAFIRYGMADWGDVDADGDLDIVYGGNMDRPDGTGETLVRILFGDAQGGYTPFDVVNEFQSPEEPWLDFNAVTWADYDSDGDMDLLVSGEWLGTGEIFGRSLVYANDAGSFAVGSQPLPAPIAGNAGGAFTWFDIDSDGDLDYFVAGAYYVPGGNGLLEARTQLFRNEAPAANAAPSTPDNLLVTNPTSDGATLTWGPSTDDRTPQASLTYDVELTASGPAIVNRKALPEPGDVSANRRWTLRGLEPGVYHWKVSALDNAFNASTPAEGMLVVQEIGIPFCAGDGSLTTDCPCGNFGESQHGCANSNPSLGGARLVAFGTTTPNTVLLSCEGIPNNNLCAFLRGTATDPAGAIFGDGLACVSGTVLRFGQQIAGQGGNAAYSVAAGTTAVSAGTTRWYQCYYRNPSPAFCPTATFNISNGVEILW